MPITADHLPRHYAPDRAAWRAWLTTHHATARGVWLVYDKKVKGQPSKLTYDDIVEEALCFGWIDSLPRKLSDAQALLLITPRKARSGWSKVNKARLPALEAAGLIAPAGYAAIEEAQKSGAWEMFDAAEAEEMALDLQQALDANPPAAQHFVAFPRSARTAILQWINAARTAPTRARRIAETARLAAQNERANQWKKP